MTNVECVNGRVTLPEWEKYHGFHCQELHLGIVSTEQFFGGDVEQEESIEGKCDTDVVDNCYVQVSMMSPATTHHTLHDTLIITAICRDKNLTVN